MKRRAESVAEGYWPLGYIDFILQSFKRKLKNEGECTIKALQLIPDALLVGAMPGDPADRCNVLYSEYDASGEAIYQIILPPGSGLPTWPPSGHAQWGDSSGNTNTVTAHDNVVDAAYYDHTHDLAVSQTATSDNA